MPIKEFILSLDAAKPRTEKFVIQDLSATRLFIEAKATQWLTQKVQEFQDQNTYQVRRCTRGNRGVLYNTPLPICLREARTIRRRLSPRTILPQPPRRDQTM